jgi:hypothetical protein
MNLSALSKLFNYDQKANGIDLLEGTTPLKKLISCKANENCSRQSTSTDTEAILRLYQARRFRSNQHRSLHIIEATCTIGRYHQERFAIRPSFEANRRPIIRGSIGHKETVISPRHSSPRLLRGLQSIQLLNNMPDTNQAPHPFVHFICIHWPLVQPNECTRWVRPIVTVKRCPLSLMFPGHTKWCCLSEVHCTPSVVYAWCTAAH